VGWVPARVQLDAGSLREKMPELDMVEALAGFLRLRQKPAPAQTARWIEDALRRFEARTTGARGRPATAVARELWGIVKLEPAADEPADLAAAHAQFAQAAARAPQSAAARNLEVVTRLAAGRAGRIAGVEARTAAEDLAAAAALDPDNRTVLQNLDVLYEILSRETDPAVRLPPDELARRREVVRRLLARPPA